MLRRADVSNDGGSGMDTNSQSADTLHTIRISQLNAFQNAQGTKATLQYHLRAIKDGHDAISADLIHVATVIMNDVHLLGQKTYDALPGYVKAFDVAILPFVMNELTIAANPLKLREYLAAGLPVVSSAIPEAARLKHLVRIGRNKLEVLNHIDTILKSGQTGPQIRISSQMDSESWDQKVEELSQIVAGVREAAA